MNRKLLNGLLVLTVAAGGVGTFTSCKDDYNSNDIINTQKDLQAQLAAIRGVTDAQFRANLEEWLNTWTSSASSNGFNSYDEMVQASNAMYQIYQSILSNSLTPDAQKYVDALYNWMFGGADINKSDWYEMIVALANKRASSIEINQTINPVFGSINLPIGLKTTVLASYLYKGDNSAEYMFPTQVRDVAGGMSHLALNFDQDEANVKALNTIQTLAAGKAIQLTNGTYTMGNGFGNMGAVYANINPSSIDFSESLNVQLVNSRDEVVLDAANGGLEVLNNEDLLSFGYTRGDQTGIYKINANAAADFSGVTVDFDAAKGYVSDIKQAISDKTISNIAYLGELLYKKFNNLLPAYALKVWWEEPVLDGAGYNGTTINSVRSAYDIAAAVIHPLSYGTSLSDAFGSAGVSSKQLPVFSPLRESLEKIGNKLSISFAGIEPISNVTFELYLTVSNGYVYAYDKDGNQVASFPYNSNGLQATSSALNSFLQAVLKGVNTEVNEQVNDQIIAALNDAIAEINANLAEYNAKVGDFLQYVENSRLYDYATKLVDIYNNFAERVNAFITNPNHYLQVAMIYSDGKGHYHHLSTDPNDPTRVQPADGGDAIELLAASYTGDVVVPSYAKYVAITSVGTKTATVADNSKAGELLNTVLPGQTHRVPVKVSGFNSGDVLTITYVSVDYHGVCSMRNYYVMVN